MKLPCEFGEYILEELLGQGGMGDVYLAMRKRDGAPVAIKTIHSHLSRLKDFMGRFHREAKLLERLAHPRVVRLYGSGVIEREDEEPTHYIAMEYVTGGKLGDVIDGKHTDVDTGKMTLSVRLDGKERVTILAKGLIHMLRQIAAVLEEAHQLGVVHRDIKPDNIIVTSPAWDVKLLDFGIARDSQDLQVSISQTGHVLGTPPYMSPEQCAGETDIDIRSDLYALGIVAYQCLTGALPFSGPTTVAYIQQHLHMAPAPLITLNPELPENLCQVVERMLAKERELRHQTPAELIEDLNRIGRGWPPLKIYSFESRSLAETSAEGGERITPTTDSIPQVSSDEIVLEDTMPAPVEAGIAGIRKQKGPLPPQPPAPEKKKRSLVAPLLILVAIIALAAYFLPLLLKEPEPADEPRPVAVQPKPPEPLEERPELTVEPWRAEWTQLIEDADKAIETQDYEKAAEACQAALALHADPEVASKLEQVNMSLREKERLAQDKLKFLDLVAQGDKNFESGYYDAAMRIYGDAINIQHDDDVAKKLQQAKDAKRKAEEVARLQSEFETCMQNGMAVFKSKDWETAKEQFEQALGIAPQPADRKRAEALLNQTKLEILKHKMELEEAAATRKREALIADMDAAEKKEDWQRMKQVAEELMKAGYVPALRALKKAEAEIQFADLCEKAREAEEAGDYKAALEYVSQALGVKSVDSVLSWEKELRSKLREKQEQLTFEETIRRAEEALKDNKSPLDMLTAAKRACALRPQDEKAKELFNNVRVAYQRWMVGTELKKSTITFDGRAVTALAVNGDMLAVAAGPSSASPEGTASLYIVEGGMKRLLVKNAHAGLVSGLAFWRDKLISVSFDGMLSVWETVSGKQVLIKKLGYRFWSLAVCNKYICAGTERGSVVLLETGSWKRVGSRDLSSQVRSLTFTTDRKAVLATASLSVVKLSLPGLDTGASYVLPAKARKITIVPDGRFAVGDSNGTIHVLRQADLRPGKKWNAHGNMVTSLQTTAGGSVLASASMNGVVAFWDAASGTELARIKGADWLMRDIVFTTEAIYAASETSGLVRWRSPK